MNEDDKLRFRTLEVQTQIPYEPHPFIATSVALMHGFIAIGETEKAGEINDKLTEVIGQGVLKDILKQIRDPGVLLGLAPSLGANLLGVALREVLPDKRQSVIEQIVQQFREGVAMCMTANDHAPRDEYPGAPPPPPKAPV